MMRGKTRGKYELSLASALTIVMVVVVIYFLFPYSKDIVSAQVVIKDETPTNATEELDVKVYPTEPLPANGTILVDITEADDIDIETIPPEGVTIVITNSTITVTDNDVSIPDQNEAPEAEDSDENDDGAEG
jgi:hypothetical protein